ncbi:MAG: hypothetical protein IKO92_05045 [Clostridia bacterium]|nr:hypothetical protein [Clostridia bacterium]
MKRLFSIFVSFLLVSVLSFSSVGCSLFRNNDVKTVLKNEFYLDINFVCEGNAYRRTDEDGEECAAAVFNVTKEQEETVISALKENYEETEESSDETFLNNSLSAFGLPEEEKFTFVYLRYETGKLNLRTLDTKKTVLVCVGIIEEGDGARIVCVR